VSLEKEEGELRLGLGSLKLIKKEQL